MCTFFENFSIFFFLLGLMVFCDRSDCLRNVLVISELFVFCKSVRGLLFFLDFCEVNSFSYLDWYKIGVNRSGILKIILYAGG